MKTRNLDLLEKYEDMSEMEENVLSFLLVRLEILGLKTFCFLLFVLGLLLLLQMMCRSFSGILFCIEKYTLYPLDIMGIYFQ